jgi:protein involved in polysaccharide export with SLBB domain
MTKLKRLPLIPILVVLSVLFSCGPALKNPAPVQPGAGQTHLDPDREYRIQVGDQLDVKFFYNPELNEQITVRPDGRISLQLVHEVAAAGSTPSELRQLLTRKYASELKKPEIAVIVRSFGGQKIFVDGEVTRPGMIALIGPMTVLQALSHAGGMKETARTQEVVIIRRGEFNKPLAFQVNVQKVINGTDTGQDVALQPFDIVYVHRSGIANVNVWVDQYIRKNIPLSTGFGYTLNP